MARFPACWPGLRITWQFGKLERGTTLSHVDLAHFFQQTLAGGGFLLLAHDAGLFVVLALLHFGKDAGLFNLLLETTQGNIEVVFVFGKKYSGHRNHHLFPMSAV